MVPWHCCRIWNCLFMNRRPKPVGSKPWFNLEMFGCLLPFSPAFCELLSDSLRVFPSTGRDRQEWMPLVHLLRLFFELNGSMAEPVLPCAAWAWLQEILVNDIDRLVVGSKGAGRWEMFCCGSPSDDGRWIMLLAVPVFWDAVASWYAAGTT